MVLDTPTVSKDSGVATRRLCGRLADARDAADAAALLESAIAERLAIANGRRAHAQLALDAADRLSRANVNAVAVDLGLSERHLRRVFHETVGVSPKAFAKVMRFRRALRVARDGGRANWTSIAAAAGYYGQAHLIAEFRAIAGVTPRALLRELRRSASAVPPKQALDVTSLTRRNDPRYERGNLRGIWAACR
jgi:AraC-like DNA-binding protein